MEGSADCLPIDFLRLLFVRVSARDLCASACTCRLWDHLTRECWRIKVRRRWRHGGNRWLPMAQSGEWKQLYRERHLHDCATRAALRDLPWPVRREVALASLVAAGDDALDELLAATAAATAPAPQPITQLRPGLSMAGGDPNASHRGPRLLGQQYWAELALAALRKREAVSLLHRLVEDPRVADERPEAGALVIAQAHYPTADLSGVERELAALGSELRRRMRAEGAPGGSLQALRILNHLLFGPPSQPSSPSSSSSAAASAAAAACPSSPRHSPPPPPSLQQQQQQQREKQQQQREEQQQQLLLQGPQPQPQPKPPEVAHDAAADGPKGGDGRTAYLVKLVGAEGGLGLRGCEVDDYYNPANSMISDVLARRRGIPISLALLHLAVARRGGLGGRLELIGLPTRVVNRFVPSAQHGDVKGGGSGCSSTGGGVGIPEGEYGACSGDGSREGGEEVFVDVFGGGTLLSWSQLRSKMAGLGVPVQRSHVRALTTGQVYERMCANLYSIYRNAGDMSCLRLALELCGAVAEQSRDLLIRRYRVSLSLEDWSDAADCLDAMTASIAAAPLSPPSAAPTLASTPPALASHLPGAVQSQNQSNALPHSPSAPALSPAPGSLQGSAKGSTAAGGAAVMDQHFRQQLTAHMSRLRRDLDDRRTAWQSSSVIQKHRPPAVLFSVGTMIQHRKYGYRGVVVDWDTSCRMDEGWIKQMGVDSLPGGGRHQPFYRVLVSDRTQSSSGGGGGGGGGPPVASGVASGDGYGSIVSGAAGCNGAATTAAAAAPAAVTGPYGGTCPQIWRAEGLGSQLRGLHNRPRSEETYVAQVNLQLVLPGLASVASVACGSASGDLSPSKLQTPACLPQPYERLAARGVTVVPVPYDFEVNHPELGYYFAAKLPGAASYGLNAALRHRFPGDGEGWAEAHGPDEEEDVWDWHRGDAWRERMWSGGAAG